MKLKQQDFQSSHKRKLNDKFNKLCRLAERFLVINNLDKNKHHYNDLLFKKLREKKQFSLLKRHLKKKQKYLQNLTVKNIDYYHYSIILEKNLLEYHYKNGVLHTDKTENISKRILLTWRLYFWIVVSSSEVGRLAPIAAVMLFCSADFEA